MECSKRSPPVHEARYFYDGSEQSTDFPDYLHVHVRTEFKLSKARRYTFAQLTESVLRSCIRHISIRLEARFKRSVPEDYYRIPAPNKRGAHLRAEVQFNEEARMGIPVTICDSVEAELFRKSKK